jgi:hypothetical protein
MIFATKKLVIVNILHQNNFFNGIAPSGYTNLPTTTTMYCVSIMGDCGADAPIYRYTKFVLATGLTSKYPYVFGNILS